MLCDDPAPIVTVSGELGAALSVDEVENPPVEELVVRVTLSPPFGAGALRSTVNGPADVPAVRVSAVGLKLSEPDVTGAVSKAPTPAGAPRPVGPL